MANQLKEKQKKLKKLRIRNIILNLVCICLAGSGLWWTATYFWRYVNYEVTNDAFVDQYVAPLNVRASGYIKEVCFKEHQYVRQGDTLLVLDNREYQIKVKEAEAALLDVHGLYPPDPVVIHFPFAAFICQRMTVKRNRVDIFCKSLGNR